MKWKVKNIVNEDHWACWIWSQLNKLMMVMGLSGVLFVNHKYDYRLNWMTWCPVTN